jgi:heme/copper-type cytochrome/quinol oxidase subunit 2
MVAAFAELLAKTAAEEGRDIILSMLVVGLIFVAVILVGDLNAWRIHRRKHRS